MAFLETLSADEGTFLVEVVVNGAMQRGEFLQTSHPPEPEYRPFPSSERLMCVLNPVIQPAASFQLVDSAQNLERRTVWSQAIRDDRFGHTLSPQLFPEEFQCRLLVPVPYDVALEHSSLVIDGTPEIVLHPVDLHENLVEVPASMPKCPHHLDPASADLRSEDGAELVPPESHCLMGNVDGSLMEQVLDIPQRHRITDILITARRMISGEVLK